MFNKKFYIGNKKFLFMFTHKPYYADENIIVMGFPYNMIPQSFNENQVNNIKGYYTYIRYNQDNITIINDILGNYRIYYMEMDNIIYFSNNFLYLFNMLPKAEREPNKFEIEYWMKHRYTTGGETLCTKIHKIKPAHIYKFSNTQTEERLYFKDIKNTPNRKKHFEEVLTDLRNTVSLIKKMPQKKFLLFSGGADSTLCVKLLQEQGVEFIPVFAKHTPTNSMNYDDILKVQYSAKILGIAPIEIEIDTTKAIDANIIDTMFTDRSITQLFFDIAKKIKNEFGENIILLNGQAADSIFAFGPTGQSIGASMARNMLFNPCKPINCIFYEIAKFINPIFKDFRMPKNYTEYLNSFFDEKFYIPIIEKHKSKNYFKQITNIIISIQKLIKNKFSLLMYLKIYSFMQGSDNYVNVQNCEYYGIKSLFLYGTQEIIYSTIKNTDYIYEIYHPKSVVYKILKDVFNYKMPNIKNKKNYKREIKQEKTFRQYEQEVYQNFYNKINSLEFADEENK